MFQIPIKYIENNLVLNNDKECFAYYEMIPYNYSFLSADQKNQIHDEFRQLIAANKNGRMHFNRTQLTIYQNEAYITTVSNQTHNYNQSSYAVFHFDATLLQHDSFLKFH